MSYLKSFIDEYQDFPKKGINFKDIIPIIKNPKIFKKLINDMSCWEPFQKCDAVLAIDARGFIFGTAEREYIFSNDLEESNLNNLNNINPNNSLTLLQ